MESSSLSPKTTSSPEHSVEPLRKAAQLSNSSAANPSGLNPRSCVTCRRRKVRCNKQYPCSNCLKAHSECIFPAPGRAARRPRKPPDGELLARLRRLEGVIQGLGMSVDEEGNHVESPADKPKDQYPNPPTPTQPKTGPERQSSMSLEHDLGRLVVNEGRSRYVNNRFWANLSAEVADLKGILDESSEDELEPSSPTSTDVVSTPSDQGFIFGFSALSQELHSLHPSKDHMQELWRIYKENCDPVIKLAHVPTIEKQLQPLFGQIAKAHRGMEAFMFSFYFAAVTSLSPEEVLARFGETRDALVKRYRFATEQALARAHFLITEELLVLHAFMIFLICLRRHEDGRVCWSLGGVMNRVAISMGLHRDGSNFGLSPFEIEIRRRTFWQTTMLDMRASQDAGIEPSLVSMPTDVQMPLNVNDDELDPAMTSFPKARVGLTEMTFCLLRFDMSKALGKLFYAGEAPLQEKERWVTECHEYLERNYFQYCDMTKSLDWCICTVAKLIMARHFLLLYQPIMRQVPPETLDRLFVTSLETLEFTVRLESERRMVKFGWLLKTYHHWHALAFILSELTRRTKGPLVQRAWRVVNNTIQEFRSEYSDKKRGHLWKPLEKLMNVARAARERELAQETQLLQNATNASMTSNLADMKPPNAQFSSFVTAPPNPAGQAISGGLNSSYAAPTADSLMDDSALCLPMLEPTISHRSNPVDDQYMADNVWTNGAPIQSQFFANQPISWLDADGNEQSLDLTTLRDTGAMPNPDMGDWLSNLDPNLIDPTNTGVGSAASIGMVGTGQHDLSTDPMVSGSDVPGSQWMDWEEMMKEFELESGRNGGYNQWQKQPVLGGSWF